MTGRNVPRQQIASQGVSEINTDKYGKRLKFKWSFLATTFYLKKMEEIYMKRGDIYYADLSPVIGSEQGGVRPVLVIQNDVGNRHSPTIICAAITSKMNKAKLPTHVELEARKYHIVKNSVVLLEQIRTIDKQRLLDHVCHLDKEIMKKIDEALKISFSLHT